MVVERKINKKKYLLAGVLTVLIFSLGITLGMIIDNERFRWIEEVNNQQEVNYQSLQFQYLFLNEFEQTNESCLVLHATLEDSIADLGFSLERFLEYKEQSALKKDSSNAIERRYMLDNLRYWLLAKKSNRICKDIDLVNILYFYSEEECKKCPEQGIILTHFKKIYGDQLLIFPINVDLIDSEPMVKILQRSYEVFSFPTIVLDDQKYEGVVEKKELEKLICRSFKSIPDECKDIDFSIDDTKDNETVKVIN